LELTQQVVLLKKCIEDEVKAVQEQPQPQPLQPLNYVVVKRNEQWDEEKESVPESIQVEPRRAKRSREEEEEEQEESIQVPVERPRRPTRRAKRLRDEDEEEEEEEEESIQIPIKRPKHAKRKDDVQIPAKRLKRAKRKDDDEDYEDSSTDQESGDENTCTRVKPQARAVVEEIIEANQQDEDTSSDDQIEKNPQSLEDDVSLLNMNNNIPEDEEDSMQVAEYKQGGAQILQNLKSYTYLYLLIYLLCIVQQVSVASVMEVESSDESIPVAVINHDEIRARMCLKHLESYKSDCDNCGRYTIICHKEDWQYIQPDLLRFRNDYDLNEDIEVQCTVFFWF